MQFYTRVTLLFSLYIYPLPNVCMLPCASINLCICKDAYMVGGASGTYTEPYSLSYIDTQQAVTSPVKWWDVLCIPASEWCLMSHVAIPIM